MPERRLAILNIVGLTPAMVGDATPQLKRYAERNVLAPLKGVFPALTTTAQASMLTGLAPAQHGIVANGWYDRDFAEIAFWKQSNRLIQGEKIYETLKKTSKDFRCSKLFWWYNMYAPVSASVTPRPHYPADGRKIIDLYSSPEGLHQSIEKKLGTFPFFNFWGPKAGIESSQWIAAAARLEHQLNTPHLQLVYLPHLDYCMQKYGPEHEWVTQELKAIDKVVGESLAFYQDEGVEVLIVSEYGIEAVEAPIHINRVLREKGWLKVRNSLTWELLDPGASAAFAVADHQIAHVYVSEGSRIDEVRRMLLSIEGVEAVLDRDAQREWQIDHSRSGDLLAIAAPGHWFSYYYWLDEARKPDFANTVDIHRKPGYDPCEMLIDEQLRFPMGKVAWRLAQKKLGFRMLMDVISTDAHRIRGSHGRIPNSEDQGPLVIVPHGWGSPPSSMLDIKDAVLKFFA